MEEPPRDRSPAGRFRYLAERRVPKALRAINSVTNLSDRKNYEFTDDQAQQIIDALQGWMADSEASSDEADS